MADARKLAFDIIDAQQDYNTKLILLCILFLYFLGALIMSFWFLPRNTNPTEVKLSDAIMGGILRIVPLPFLFFFPLFSLFMARGYDFFSLYELVLVGYGVSFTILFVYFLVFGFEKLMEWFGLGNFLGRSRRRMRKR